MKKNTHGGSRPNSGRKTNYVSMEVKLPGEDKAAINEKYGRSFNQLFRDWVKEILTVNI